MPQRRTSREVQQKLVEYEEWVNDTLKSDLSGIYKEKALYQHEQSELRQLLIWLQRVMQDGSSEPVKTMVEIGAGVYCAAKIPDVGTVYMNVGLGFHVECTLAEAQDIINGKLLHLQERLATTDKKIARQKATIKFAVQAVGELSGLL